MAAPRPFKIDIPESVLDEQRQKLKLARLPDELELPSGDEWKFGTPLSEIKRLVAYWQDGYDWRKTEARLNEMPQFQMHVQAGECESIDMHFVHKLSTRPNAKPLVFLHGWPGSFIEVEKVLDRYTEPSDPADQAFHVVAPSLPGFVFSAANKKPNFGIFEIAATIDALMVQLGYPRYVAQGGDWGSFVARAIAMRHSDHCRAIHVNMFALRPPSKFNPVEVVKYLAGGYTAREVEDLRDTQRFMTEETGYQAIQGTKPQTLNYGLVDSPVAQLAWIREKLHTWTDGYRWSDDELLDWANMYYLTRQPATRIYKEFIRSRMDFVASHVPVPVAVSNFPKELYKFPRAWVQKVAPQLLLYSTHDKGGHFAATERPDELVKDTQDFVRLLKANKAWVERAKF